MFKTLSLYVITIVVVGLLGGCAAPAANQAGNQANAKPATNAAETATKTTAMAPAKEAPHWDYEANGPAKWSTLNKEWETCGSGKEQSPIDIQNATSAKLPALAATFKPADLKIVHHEHQADAINNGHTIQVNYSEGDTLTIGDEKYALKQYHFHGPSEHTVNGKHSPMEMHMVHQSDDKKLAVVAVLIEEGSAAHAAFEPIWNNLPKTKSEETHFTNVKVDVNQLLPATQTTYRYSGSLTTPPCSEKVNWIVFTDPIKLSAAQIGKFTSIIKNNNRPTQPLNGRAIGTDRIDEKAAK